MTGYKNKYRIATARLPGWDYAAGGRYFVTICARDRQPFFGEVVQGEMNLSSAGMVVSVEWQKTEHIRAIGVVDFAWQPRFYDHIIHDQPSLDRIRRYIRDNPPKWETDRNNPMDLYI